MQLFHLELPDCEIINVIRIIWFLYPRTQAKSGNPDVVIGLTVVWWTQVLLPFVRLLGLGEESPAFFPENKNVITATEHASSPILCCSLYYQIVFTLMPERRIELVKTTTKIIHQKHNRNFWKTFSVFLLVYWAVKSICLN